MKNKGIQYILLSSLFFALMSVSVKSIPDVPQVQKIFFRNFIGLMVISATLYKTKTFPVANNKKLILLRCIFGLLGVSANYYALSKLLLADSIIIHKLSPFFVMILSYFFLGEKFTKGKSISLVFALTGALFVIKPSFNVNIFPFAVAVTGAFLAGCAYTIIRKLSESDSPKIIVFYFCLFSSLITFPLMFRNGFDAPNLKEFFFLLAIGITALIAQLFMTTAYRYAEASELSIYTNVNILFSMFFGLVLWSEIPDIYSLFGGFLVVAAGYINYKMKIKST
ncbi:MAG: DMT family transporter [Acidaminobacteraceae bacterium]